MTFVHIHLFQHLHRDEAVFHVDGEEEAVLYEGLVKVCSILDIFAKLLGCDHASVVLYHFRLKIIILTDNVFNSEQV